MVSLNQNRKMMKRIVVIFITLLVMSCKDRNSGSAKAPATVDVEVPKNSPILEDEAIPIVFNQKEAATLARLPLECIETEYPNKLNQTLANEDEIKEPKELHPAFYGCFDWHSAVHGHWSLVALLKEFPELNEAESIREKLKNSLSKENIAVEVAYFQKEHNKSFERTYGWAWLLKLAEEIHTWNDPLAQELEGNLQPLTDVIVQKFKDFLPKLQYPIRVGEHSNTAFALSFAYDFAVEYQDEEFQELIVRRAREFYLNDDNCPLEWEPSGFDFLSPCFSEIDIMRKVLPKNAFHLWMEDFLPQLKNKDFQLEVGEVSDRTDGKLIHLDGLNFSRAWVLYGLAKHYPEYVHLKGIANEHMEYSYPNLVGDTYEGGHWLGSFALYALRESSVD